MASTRDSGSFARNIYKTKSLLRVIDQNSVTIQRANETRSGHNCKYLKKKLIRQGTVNRAGRKTVRGGRSALRNMPSWNTANVVLGTMYSDNYSRLIV